MGPPRVGSLEGVQAERLRRKCHPQWLGQLGPSARRHPPTPNSNQSAAISRLEGPAGASGWGQTLTAVTINSAEMAHLVTALSSLVSQSQEGGCCGGEGAVGEVTMTGRNADAGGSRASQSHTRASHQPALTSAWGNVAPSELERDSPSPGGGWGRW